MSNLQFMQIIKQSDEEKLKMYLKNNSKKQLAKMLIEANRQVDNIIDSQPLVAIINNKAYASLHGNKRWRRVFGMDRLPDDELNLSKEEYIQIYIESVKEDEGFGPGPDGRGFYPVSTIGYYRTNKGGKKNYFIDADSGEQGGLATNIPEEVKKILLSFGLEKRRDE